MLYRNAISHDDVSLHCFMLINWPWKYIVSTVCSLEVHDSRSRSRFHREKLLAFHRYMFSHGSAISTYHWQCHFCAPSVSIDQHSLPPANMYFILPNSDFYPEMDPIPCWGGTSWPVHWEFYFQLAGSVIIIYDIGKWWKTWRSSDLGSTSKCTRCLFSSIPSKSDCVVLKTSCRQTKWANPTNVSNPLWRQ